MAVSKIPPKQALLLGWGGALPVVVGALVILVLKEGTTVAFLERALLVYGALILSFIGGAHWGLASRGQQPGSAGREDADVWLLTKSVVPSLLGWFLVLYNGPFKFTLLGVLFLAMLPLDRWAVQNGFAPAWWMGLRIPLTLTMAVGFLVIAFAR